MISTTGTSPPQITESASSPFCSSSTALMVSSHSPGGQDADPKSGFINGDSPHSNAKPDSRLPPPVSLCHMVATVAPKPVPSPEMEGKSLDAIAEGQPASDCHVEDLTRSSQARNKRKNFKPRNIIYHYSEIDSGSEGEEDDGEASSRTPAQKWQTTTGMGSYHSYNTEATEMKDASEDNNNDTAQPLDLSSENSSLRSRMNAWSPKSERDAQCSTYNPVNLSLRRNDSEKSNNEDDQTHSFIDNRAELSPSQHQKPLGHNEAGMSCRGVVERDSPIDSRSRRKSLEMRSPRSDPHHSITVRTSMSDYAENTVKELLGMYGLNESLDLSPNNLPTSNSDVLPPSHSSCIAPGSDYCPSDASLQLIHQQQEQADAFAKFNSQTLSKEPFNHYPDSQCLCDPEVNSIQPMSEKSEDVIRALRAKMAHSMPHVGQLAPNSAIPAPHQMMLPQNMATIFTIAALGSKLPQTQASPESTPAFTASGTTAESQISCDSSVATTCSSSSTAVSPALSNRTLSSTSPFRLDQHQKLAPVDYTRYVKRFSNAAECGNNYCKDLNYREHFHCMDCNSRVFVKKEEMIRHFKWHKKRDDSLQHGFMRYSPMDDCSDRFYNCSHNRKQTHYHCLKESCDKVYISTSDVQMHANYHRKDSAIIQEGFQRFRATENCSTASCLFFGQRTTHFHCRRSGCSFTFKNKADMEKHKSYHIKDEQLNKDGFKKFMKHEHCSFENCRFSRVCNHIHCIRPGCTYVLHSSGQLYSHKRKHERRDTELAYRKFKLAQSMIKTLSESGGLPQGFVPEGPSSGESSSSPAPGPLQLTTLPFASLQGNSNFLREDVTMNDCYTLSLDKVEQSWNYPNLSEAKNSMFPAYSPQASSPAVPTTLAAGDTRSTPEDITAVDLSMEQHKNSDNLWQTYLVRYGASELCQPQCEFLYKDHFHCNTDNCSMTFRAKDIVGVKEHACNHEYQEQVTKSFYTIVEISDLSACPSDCHFKAKEKHYHCKWEKCEEVISGDDNPFRRLDHYKIHKYSRKLSASVEHIPSSSTSSPTVENMFRRKRGRPPKNRMIEYPIGPSQFPQAMYSSFKLPKLSDMPHQGLQGSFDPFTSVYNAMSLFPPPPDMISAQTNLSQLIPVTGLGAAMFTPNNLFQISTQAEKMGSPNVGPSSPIIHSEAQDQNFQQKQVKPEVHEGFYVYSKNVQCPDRLCAFHTENHFHCMQPRCFYVTDRSDILLLHSKDFHDNIDILDGFVFYDRSVDCRLPGCHSNKINRHFHCVRSNCNYSFVRYSTMTIHDQKHKEQENGSSPACSRKKTSLLVNEERNNESLPTFVKSTTYAESSQPKTTVVKATGTFYPLSAFSTTQSSYTLTNSLSSSVALTSEPYFSAQEKKCRESDGRSEVLSLTPSDADHPVTQVLPHHGMHSVSLQANEKHVMYGLHQSCNKPFCRLGKKDHFHCNVCSQAIVGFSHLQAHVLKHSDALSPTSVYPSGQKKQSSPSPSVDDEECGDLSDAEDQSQFSFQNNVLNEGSKPELNATKQDERQLLPSQLLSWHCTSNSSLRTVMKSNLPENNANSIGHLSGNNLNFFGSSQLECSSLEDPSKMELKRQFSKGFEDHNEIKKMKIAALRILKDEPIPEGYIRCRFNEDCGYSHCGYREHQTHFHCLRKDCGYSFCDKTRFVQHTARHERLDTLMGGDFQQYRANVNCGREECMYANTMGTMANKSSHFHCLKCDFVCTDTNKVVAHRRQHAKMDNIYAAGFEKYTPSQSCNVEGCNHNQKQTHYHCLKCQYSVLGLSQMSSHKYRHMEC